MASDGSGPTMAYVSDAQKPWVVPAMRTAEFSLRTAKLLQDEGERRRLAAHGREYVQRYSLQRARTEFLREVMDIEPPESSASEPA